RKFSMRWLLLATTVFFATGCTRSGGGSAGLAPRAETVEEILKEERFADRARFSEIRSRPGAYGLEIHPSAYRPYTSLDEAELQRLLAAVAGFNVDIVAFTGEPA